MSSIDDLNIINGLTVEDITATTISCDGLTSNSAIFDSVQTNNIYCKNINLDISQNLNLSGSISALSLASNTLSANFINANIITRPSDNERYATLKDVSNCYTSIVAGAPGFLDTLSEIAQSLNNEVSFASTVYSRLNKNDTSLNTIDTLLNNTIMRINNHDMSLNTIDTLLNNTTPRINNHDTSLNTITTTINNLTTTLNTKITNVINQDIFLSSNLYVSGTNKFISFLNSSNVVMSSLITRSDYTLFNHVSSLVSGGWSFCVDGVPKLNIDQNGGINMNEDINCAGAITSTGINTSSEIKTGKITFSDVPSINHIQFGTASPSLNGSYRVQFSKVFPQPPSVTVSPIYAGAGYMISILLTAVDTSGFNFRVIARSATGSMEFFEQYCQVSWQAIG
jgi:hypothetical protein